MKVPIDQIKKVRDLTGAPVVRVKSILEEVGGDEKKAYVILNKEGFEKAAKRESRETKQGLVYAYTHHSGKVACIVEVLCETDFVARNEIFQALVHDLALQIASMGPKDIKELGNQEFIKDPIKKVSDLIKEVKMKTGENIRLGRFSRISLGEK